VCQPLIAQNNLLGLLYREQRGAPSFDAGANQLATMLAEQVSLAIANLELREQLRGQAIRDALTGLHNRAMAVTHFRNRKSTSLSWNMLSRTAG